MAMMKKAGGMGMMDPQDMGGKTESTPAPVSQAGPILTVEKAQAPDVVPGDQVKIMGIATVTDVGDQVELQIMDIKVTADTDSEMQSGFDMGAKDDMEDMA